MSVSDFATTRKTLFEACLSGDLSALFTDQINIDFDNYSQNYDSNETSVPGTTRLLLAFLRDDQQVFQFLVESLEPDLEALLGELDNLNDPEGKVTVKLKATYFWYACRSSSLDIVKYLVSKGANVNQNNEILLRSTPLM